MSDPIHHLVDAVLTATPLWGGVYDDPRPVAARQAAAVIRWLAAWDGDGCKCWRCIRDLADQLDTEETHTDAN